MKNALLVVFLVGTILIVGCTKSVENPSDSTYADVEFISMTEFEEYRQQTDEIISDLKNELLMQNGKIKRLISSTVMLESKIWKLDDNNIEYFNEEYNFGLYLPSDFLDSTVIESEESEDWTKVHFYYGDYKFEDGYMQEFFSVFITSPEKEVSCCGTALEPYMIKNSKAYYILTSLDNILPAEENVKYKDLSFSYPELIERCIKE